MGKISAYVGSQFEWAKSILVSEDHLPTAPDHKTVIVIAFAVAFLISFLKKTVGATEIPDIPEGWLVFFLTALAFRGAQSTITKYLGNKK